MSLPTTQINVHCLRVGITPGDVPVPPGYSLEVDEPELRLFLQSEKLSPPHWLNYLKPYLAKPPNEIRNRTCSFVLLRQRGERTYALTGGYGHNVIRSFSSEDFGIQVALRLIKDDTSIAGITQRSMKGNVRQVFRSVSGYSPGLDRENYNRLLNALEGKGAFEARTFRVRGRTAISLRTERPIGSLDEVLNELESLLSQEPKIAFPRSYDEVTEADVLSQLDQSLSEAFTAFWLGTGSRDEMYLEFLDPWVQSKCDEFEFRFDRRKVLLTDFDLGRARDALRERGARTPESIDDLGRLRSAGFNEFGQAEFENQPFSKLLVYETKRPEDERTYIRLGGRWFRILDEVQEFLDDQLGYIPILRDILPVWNRSLQPSENDYNLYAAKQLSIPCLDRDLVQLPSRSRIEVCDMFDRSTRRFIHVKATWGSKAAYLFAQGLVSGELYRNSAQFRALCGNKWPEIFADDLTAEEVVFAIADNRACLANFPRNLSYFAKVTLYEAASTLRSLGFRVALAPVPIDE